MRGLHWVKAADKSLTCYSIELRLKSPSPNWMGGSNPNTKKNWVKKIEESMSAFYVIIKPYQ
jgi:hypothetical protein